jgi:hypothetical protein
MPQYIITLLQGDGEHIDAADNVQGDNMDQALMDSGLLENHLANMTSGDIMLIVSTRPEGDL